MIHAEIAEKRAKQCEATKRLFDKRRAAGICTRCGENPGKPKTCVACLAKARDATKASTEKRRSAGRCAKCGGPSGTRYKCDECRAATTRWRKSLRAEVINYYSGGTNRCGCCGEGEFEFLTVDHVNNDGARHRRVHLGHLYFWLRKSGFPVGFEVLCYNCNCAKGKLGVCPHQLRRQAADGVPVKRHAVRRRGEPELHHLATLPVPPAA